MSFEVLGLVEAPATHGAVERPMSGVGGHVGTVLAPCYGLSAHLHHIAAMNEGRR